MSGITSNFTQLVPVSSLASSAVNIASFAVFDPAVLGKMVNLFQSKKSNITEEEKELYLVVTQALKVILNASYGVMGAEIFPLYYLPAAESTTGMGRHIIIDTSSNRTGSVTIYIYTCHCLKNF